MMLHLKTLLARWRFKRAFLRTQPATASSKAHVRTKPTMTEAELQARVHDALRRSLSA